jgi:hypothetical protein
VCVCARHQKNEKGIQHLPHLLDIFYIRILSEFDFLISSINIFV